MYIQLILAGFNRFFATFFRQGGLLFVAGLIRRFLTRLVRFLRLQLGNYLIFGVQPAAQVHQFTPL